MKKGGDLDMQVRVYEDYIKGLFDGTHNEIKAKDFADKMDRFYYYDLKGKDTHTLDHIKKLQKAQMGMDMKMTIGDVHRAKEKGVDADHKQMTTLSSQDKEIQNIRENTDFKHDLTKDDLETWYNFTPVLGETIDAKNTIKALKEGKKGEAALHALGFAIPFVPGGALVKGWKKGKGAIKNLFNKGSKETVEKVTKEIPEWSKGIPRYAHTDEARKKALNSLMDQGKHLDEIGFDAKTLKGENMVFHGQHGGRSVVEVALPDGKTQMFYKSTDMSGKGVGDMWQPFGGFDESGWFIKDGPGGYNIGNYQDFYNSKSYKDIASSLDQHMVDQAWDMSDQIIRVDGIDTFPYRK